MKIKTISKETLDYVYEHNSWLYWKKSNGCVKKNNLAGYLDKSSGYYRVHINDKTYYNHRILYQIYHNVILEPNQEIDHINGVKTDNRKENLRPGLHSKNMMNKKTQKNNKSTGIKNITIKKTENSYRLKITANKVLYVEYFKMNEFTLDDVIEIRDKKLLELHGPFARYD